MPRKTKTRAVAAQTSRATRANLGRPAPRTAWFIFGSNESLLTNYDLVERAGRVRWNGSRHAEIGDIVFFYYIAPEQAIHFVARVTSQPVRELWNRGGYQWWVDCDSMIRIEPIHLSEIRDAFGEERLLVYARGGMYIRPDIANRLIEKARPKFWISMRDLDKVLCEVVGRKELGEPSTITLDGLRELESADLTFEAEVEYHVLEPLLRLARIEQQSIIRKLDLPNRKTADYAAKDQSGQKVRCIIEAKLNLGKRSNWQKNRHVKQAREYAKMCKAPGFVVMDRDRIVCFRTPDELPCLVLDRTTLDESGLSALRAHILNENRVHPNDRQDRPSSKTRPRRRGR